MAPATNDFDCWLANLAQIIETYPRHVKLEMLAGHLRLDFGARIWFVRIFGKRWSHLAGEFSGEPIDENIQQIPLYENHSMLIQSKGELRDDQFESLIIFINKKILKIDDIETSNKEYSRSRRSRPE